MAKQNSLITTTFILVAFIAAAAIPLFIWIISDFFNQKLFYNYLLNNISVFSFLAFCLPLSWLIVVLMNNRGQKPLPAGRYLVIRFLNWRIFANSDYFIFWVYL